MRESGKKTRERENLRGYLSFTAISPMTGSLVLNESLQMEVALGVQSLSGSVIRRLSPMFC